MPLTIMVPPILIIRHWRFQPPVPCVTQQIRAGSRQPIPSMTLSSSLSIQEDIRANGRIAANVIPHLITIYCLIVLTVTAVPIGVRDIQMRNVTVAIPGGLPSKLNYELS